MAEKEIRIYDTSNAVLKVASISFELFDASTGTLIAKALSCDLNPGHDEWGVLLPFPAGSTPLEVYTTDPRHQYPGNTIVSLEGYQTDRIDIDLQKLPSHPGGNSSKLVSSNPYEVSQWIRRGEKWTIEEKRAVRNLALNYIRLRLQLEEFGDSGLYNVERNWRESLKAIDMDPDVLSK
jgi:hypothetical protein